MHRIGQLVRERFHGARARLFVDLMHPREGARLLDLGGSDGSFAARIAQETPLSVTVADLSPVHRKTVEARGFRYEVLRDDQGLPFDDGEFDIVLCNSVIEHVTLPLDQCRVTARVEERAWRDAALCSQAAFAREIRRVGRSYFVQTPHRYFPIDAHIHLPLTNFLSHNNVCRVVSLADKYWIKKCDGVADWQLLLPDDMKRLFPDANIHVESVLGAPKSIVAFRRSA